MLDKNIHLKNVKLDCLDIDHHFRFHRNQSEKFKEYAYGVNSIPGVFKEYTALCDRVEELHRKACYRGSVRGYLDCKVAINLAVFNLVVAIQKEEKRGSALTQEAAKSLLRLIESRIHVQKGMGGVGDLIRMLRVGHYNDYVRHIGVAGLVMIVEICNEKFDKIYNTWLGDVERNIVKEVENGLSELDTLYHKAEQDLLSCCVENKSETYFSLFQGLWRGEKGAQKECRMENAAKPVNYWKMVKCEASPKVWTERNMTRVQNVLCHRRRGHRNS